MLLNAFYRLEFDSLVSMLNSKSIIVFQFFISLSNEINRFPTQLGNHVVNGVFVSIMTQYLNLQVDMTLLVLL